VRDYLLLEPAFDGLVPEGGIFSVLVFPGLLNIFADHGSLVGIKRYFFQSETSYRNCNFGLLAASHLCFMELANSLCLKVEVQRYLNAKFTVKTKVNSLFSKSIMFLIILRLMNNYFIRPIQVRKLAIISIRLSLKHTRINIEIARHRFILYVDDKWWVLAPQTNLQI
jgi:hypothetical protein